MRPEPLAFPADPIILLREERDRFKPIPSNINLSRKNESHLHSHLPDTIIHIDTEDMDGNQMDTIAKLADLGSAFVLEYYQNGYQHPAYSKLISGETLRKFHSNEDLFNYLQSGFSCGKNNPDYLEQSHHSKDSFEPLADPIDPELIKEELYGLAPTQCIFQKLKFGVFIIEPSHAPNTLLEVGRLREKTFRAVGEGTGKCRDLDEFDNHYYQLVIYDTEEDRIVGGYRLAHGPQLMRTSGVEGFYIHRLFDLQQPFYDVMSRSVELGRSYIVFEYQKQRLPLFLLWRGILHFLTEHPQIKYLYGPVSISKYYSDLSKGFIIEFLRRHYFDHDLAKWVNPRKAFRPITSPFNYESTLEKMGNRIQDLDRLIDEIDPHFFRIPVLMRQYIRQNAKFIGFNVDPNFSDALDGFMIVNLQNIPNRTLDSLRNIA